MSRPGAPSIRRLAGAAAASGLFALLGWVLLALPERPAGLTEPALAALGQSGVSHPVTAVLLNYRAYDTLLEVGVLLLAVVGVWSVGRPWQAPAACEERPLLLALARLTLPPLVVVGGVLLWQGAFAPGGAFQGGSLLGGAAMVALLVPLLRRWTPARTRLLRLGLSLGLLTFVAVALGLTLAEGVLLRLPPASAGAWILLIEAAATPAIGLTLAALYLGGEPPQAPEEERHG